MVERYLFKSHKYLRGDGSIKTCSYRIYLVKGLKNDTKSSTTKNKYLRINDQFCHFLEPPPKSLIISLCLSLSQFIGGSVCSCSAYGGVRFRSLCGCHALHHLLFTFPFTVPIVLSFYCVVYCEKICIFIGTRCFILSFYYSGAEIELIWRDCTEIPIIG